MWFYLHTIPESFSCWNKKLSHNTVNFLYSGHCRDLELVSSLARLIRNSESLCQTNVCNIFFAGDLAAVRIIGVSARRELTVVWTRIWYGTLNLRDRRRAASLCYKNGADQPLFLGVHPVWFSCWRKSYPAYCEHRLSCSLYDIYTVSHYPVWKVVSNRWKTTQRSNAKIQPTFCTLRECSYGNMNLSVRNYETWKTNN